jgi:hypothetical protein
MESTHHTSKTYSSQQILQNMQHTQAYHPLGFDEVYTPYFQEKHSTSIQKQRLHTVIHYEIKSIHINYQRPISAVTKSSTTFRTITSIDLKLRRYENKTVASMKNPHIHLNRDSFLILVPTPQSMIITSRNLIFYN